MNAPTNITLIGCGKMGSALLQGWKAADTLNANFSVIEPNPNNVTLPETHHFKTVEDAAETLKTANTIILAVKPQVMSDICSALKPQLNDNALILSIAAGQSIATFETYFSPQQPIIRAMPNTPAAIGKGISVAIANAHVSAEQKTLAGQLLESAGKFEWSEDENLLDAVTALSGSGPAYVFHLIETLAAAGENAGLPADMATTLARQTVIGAAALAESKPQTPATTLRENVTSPGGTTAAALDILMNGKLQKIYDEALQAATKRSRELSG